jgi:aminoglycoside 6'-N-acetyltransferase I
MKHTFCTISRSGELMEEAAHILFTAFQTMNGTAWPAPASALQEVKECIAAPNMCIGICVNNVLAGWVGLRPMYEKTWELHPLVIAPQHQHKGLGTLLIRELEEKAREQGIIGILLGTDDETYSTSLSQQELTGDNICHAIMNIRNMKKHPYEFYQKCGYVIVGVIPNANGVRKPDIWMWKNLL